MYALKGTAVERLVAQCDGGKNVVVELAVMTMKDAQLTQNLRDDILVGLTTEFALSNAAKAKLSALLRNHIARAINSRFSTQSFLLAAGWAR